MLILGRNPSKHNTSRYTPFVGTKSNDTLQRWLKYLTIDTEVEVLFKNCSYDLNATFTTYNTQRYAIEVIDYCIENDIDSIICLGNDVEKVCEVINCMPYFKLPHPSGLNRQNNDKKYIESRLSECREWLRELRSSRRRSASQQREPG